MLRSLAILTGVLALSIPANAADLKVGDTSPVFAKLAGTDGKEHSLSDYKQDILVVAITCNQCPAAVAYEDRIIEFVKKHGSEKVGYIAINVNNGESDRMDKMKERAKEKGFNFPYLYDPSQEIAKALNAKVTPEFYVLNKERKIVYMGAFDDSMRDASKATKNYLEAAVKEALEGKTVTTSKTKAVGCGVAYDTK